jgi:hypothetical protein
MFVLIMVVTPIILLPRMERQAEARAEARTPEQKERFAQAERQRVFEAQKDDERQVAREVERLKAERLVQTEREIEADARQENRLQREFYEQLGAPKLLYRCNTNPFEIAIGAQFGTVNRLIGQAKDKCGEAGYEILKRKD